jgi:superfamily II DNA or RNA helicase
LQNDGDVLVVLPTGGGKTIVYSLVPFVENDRFSQTWTPPQLITVIILPLVILKADQFARLSSGGNLKILVWDKANIVLDDQGIPFGRENYNVADIVIVSAETAGSAMFMKWVSFTAAMGKLRRIVVDEAHLLLEQHHFRRIMLDLQLLRPASSCVRICAFTATAPPSTVPTLLAFVGASPFTTKVIRVERTDRPNIIYASRKEETWSAVKLRVSDLASQATDGKTMIFCTTHNDVDEIIATLTSNQLEAIKYVGEGLSREAKETAWDLFSNQLGPRILVGTSCAGLGADLPNVRLVIVVGAVAGWTWWSQLSGRAGRDGRKANVVLVWSPDTFAAYTQRFRLHDPGQEASRVSFEKFAEVVADMEDACLRRMMAENVDEVRVEDCFGSMENCSRCSEALLKWKPQPFFPSDVTASNPSPVKEEALGIVRGLKMHLSRITFECNQGRLVPCAYCFVTDPMADFYHPLNHRCRGIGQACFGCMMPGHQRSHCPYRREMTRSGIICFYCHLPLGGQFNNGFHSGAVQAGNPQSCDSGGRDFLIQVCFALFDHKDERIGNHALSLFGVNQKERKEFADWMIQFQHESVPVTNSVRLFFLACEIRESFTAAFISAGVADDDDEFDSPRRTVGRKRTIDGAQSNNSNNQ